MTFNMKMFDLSLGLYLGLGHDGFYVVNESANWR